MSLKPMKEMENAVINWTGCYRKVANTVVNQILDINAEDAHVKEVKNGVWTGWTTSFQNAFPLSMDAMLAKDCMIHVYQHTDCTIAPNALHLFGYPICPYCGAEMITGKNIFHSH